MNTNKWGPSGWDQLGPVSHRYDRLHNILPVDHRNTYGLLVKTHLTNTENMLPCKYCRESYAIYIRELPINDSIVTGDLKHWMYLMHNKVNNKLRKQGYNNKPDPTEAEANKTIAGIAKDFYRSTGWDYIHCIGHNYPENGDVKSMVVAKIHFSTLPYLLPHPQLTVSMLEFMRQHPIDKVLNERGRLVLWLYLLHEHLLPVYRTLQPGNNISSKTYSDTCAYYETFRAGCGLSAGKSGPSCRLPVASSVRTENLKKLLN
jgi:hypothetical protein